MNIILFASNNTITPTIGGILILFAFLFLLSGIGVIYSYTRKVKRQIAAKKTGFETTVKGKYQIFNFWNNYVYVFIVGVCFIAFLILLGIGIGSFFSH